MPDDDIKQRIFRHRAQIQAYGVLIDRKRALYRTASQWAQLHQAELWTRRLEQQVEGLEECRKQVMIAAISGIVMLIGGAVVGAYLANARGFTYATGRLLKVPLRPYLATNAAGQTLTLGRIADFSLRNWVAAKVAAFPVTAIVSSTLARAAAGTTLAGVFAAWVFKDAPISEEQLSQLKSELSAEGIGGADLQAALRDPRSSPAAIRAKLRPAFEQQVIDQIAERLQFIEQPLAGLLFMDSAELARWYGEFRPGVERQINEALPKLSAEQRSILRMSVLMDFWIDVLRSLDEEEAYLQRCIGMLQEAIKEEQTTLKMHELLRAQQRAPARPPARR